MVKRAIVAGVAVFGLVRLWNSILSGSIFVPIAAVIGEERTGRLAERIGYIA